MTETTVDQKLIEIEKRLARLEKVLLSLESDPGRSKEARDSSVQGSDRKKKKTKDNKKSAITKQTHVVEEDEFSKIEGVEGVFDGYFMNLPDGSKIEVPSNYSAKSRLVYGDVLKMIEVSGEKKFKNIKKKVRKKVEGVLSKKEDVLYVLTEFGSHRVSDTVIEHNKLSPGDVVAVYLPEDEPKVPFATFDKIVKSLIEQENLGVEGEQHGFDKQEVVELGVSSTGDIDVSPERPVESKPDIEDKPDKVKEITTSSGTFTIGNDDLM